MFNFVIINEASPLWSKRLFRYGTREVSPFSYCQNQNENYFDASSDSFLNCLRSFSSSSDTLRARVPAALLLFSIWRLASFENWSNNSQICVNVFSIVMFLILYNTLAKIAKYFFRTYISSVIYFAYNMIPLFMFFPFWVFPYRTIGKSGRRDFICKGTVSGRLSSTAMLTVPGYFTAAFLKSKIDFQSPSHCKV